MDGAPDDASAIAALRSRNEVVVGQVVAAWTPGMLRLARAHTTSDAAAEDVVQDVWVTVLTKLDSFEGRSALRTWVLGIVVNTARGAGRRERRTLPFSAAWRTEREDGRTPAVDPTRFDARSGAWALPPLRWDLLPEEQLAAAELRAVIDTALAALPARQRTVMTARDFLGLSVAEVAALYGLSDGNQRVLLHRARSKVRAVVEHYAATSIGVPAPAAAIPERAFLTGSASRRRPARPSRHEPVACRQLVELVTDYFEGALDPALRNLVEAHLADCHDCNGYVAQVRRMLDVTANLAPTATPEFIAQLAVALRNATIRA